MSAEVAVMGPEVEREKARPPETTALTPEEWMVVRFYRGLGEQDQLWMRRVLSSLVQTNSD